MLPCQSKVPRVCISLATAEHLAWETEAHRLWSELTRHTHRELCSCINLQRLGVQLFVNICDLGETLWSAVEGGVGMGTIRGLAKV